MKTRRLQPNEKTGHMGATSRDDSNQRGPGDIKHVFPRLRGKKRKLERQSSGYGKKRRMSLPAWNRDLGGPHNTTREEFR